MISLCMIAKNEEHFLTGCLASVQGAVDEIVLVDTGSTDSTVRLGEELGAKVFTFTWVDDFAAARNFSLSKASGDWILYLDADEELEPGGSDRLKRLADSSNIDGYYFQIVNVSEKGNPLRHINLRLFQNKPGYRFEGRLHEQIVSTIQRMNENAVIINSGLSIIHYGYLPAVFLAKDKARRNMRINEQIIESEPDNSFYLYTLGNSYINFNEIEKASESYRKALKHINFKAHYAPSVLMSHITCLVKLGKIEEALSQIERCRLNYPDYVDIYYVEAELCLAMGHILRAKHGFEKCLELGEHASGKYTTTTGVGSFMPAFHLAKIYQSLGDLDRAIYYQFQGLKVVKNELSHFITLARLLKQRLNDSQRLVQVLRKLVTDANSSAQQLHLAHLLFETGEYSYALAALDQIPETCDKALYLRGSVLMRQGYYNKAIDCFKLIGPGSPLFPEALTEAVLAHWLCQPARDAAPFMKTVADRTELYDLLADVNTLLFRQTNTSLKIRSSDLRNIVNRLFVLEEVGLVLKILTAGGLNTSEQIGFLSTAPLSVKGCQLGVSLALGEIKAGHFHPDYFYVLGWYLLGNNEFLLAMNMLKHAMFINPGDLRYAKLLKEIYRQQAVKVVVTALAHFPDNGQLYYDLARFQRDSLKHMHLKGVH